MTTQNVHGLLKSAGIRNRISNIFRGVGDDIAHGAKEVAQSREGKELARDAGREAAHGFKEVAQSQVGKDLATAAGADAAKGFQKGVDPLLKKLPGLSRQAGTEAASGALSRIGDAAGVAGRNIAAGTALGATTGAASQLHTEDGGEVTRGALRGALGGLAGGALGRGFGAGAGALGATLGGVAAGTLPKALEEKEVVASDWSSSMPNRFSGVTVDFYDDLGETLKAHYPTRDDLPDVVKTASVQPKEKLANEQFALVMVDQGHAFRKFACNDAGTATMSAIYFMEHGDKLPAEAQKTAAANISKALLSHGIQPPSEMLKAAGGAGEEKLAQVIDITGKLPAPKIKKAAAISDDDYAVVMDDGSRYYPIHTWDLMKTAEQYYEDENRRMHPEVRHQFATKLAAKADVIGYPLSAELLEKGASTYASADHREAALEMRKVACAPGAPREFLEGLLEKSAEIEPGTYAEVLRRFDVEQGLDQGWGHLILDPWDSTFGIDKTATVVWEQGADRVTDKALLNLAENHLDVVIREFTDNIAEGFKIDPLAVFKSMPTPQKKILARMAMDSESVGGAEHGFVG